MDLKAEILKRFETSSLSLHLHHLVFDDWIMFQRNTFDHFDENKDPFVSQIFLVEISTGRYIYRSQGHKVDHGTTLNIDVLENKLIHVFLSTQACSGIPLSNDGMNILSGMTTVDYPYQRYIANECQFIVNCSNVKRVAETPLCCSPCFEAQKRTNLVVIHLKPTVEDLEPKLESNNPLNLEEHKSYADEIMDIDNDADDLWMSDDETSTIKKNVELEPSVSLEDKAKEHKCSHCSQVFETPEKLRSHRWKRKVKQRARRKVDCMDCDEDKIITFQQLRKHVALKHPERLKNYLSILPEEPEPNAMDHPLKCSLCGWMNNGVALNFRHRELYHDLGDHVCDECQEPNLTHYDLIIHRYQKHFKLTKFLPLSTHGLDPITKEDGKVEMRKSKVICQLCLKEYKKDDGMIRHLRTVHSWGMFSCEPCGEGCHFAQDLSTHVIQFHMDNPIVKCPSCTKDCNLGEDCEEFNVHYKECIRKTLKLQTKSSFQCEICGKAYSNKNNLELHVDAHQGNIRFKCSFCEFGTNHKNVIEDHERTHLVDQAISRGTGKDLLHPCERCGKHLRTAKLLKRHIRVVHEGIKPSYPCRECGVVFQYYVPLCRHRREEHGVIVGNKHKKS